MICIFITENLKFQQSIKMVVVHFLNIYVATWLCSVVVYVGQCIFNVAVSHNKTWRKVNPAHCFQNLFGSNANSRFHGFSRMCSSVLCDHETAISVSRVRVYGTSPSYLVHTVLVSWLRTISCLVFDGGVCLYLDQESSILPEVFHSFLQLCIFWDSALK